MAKQFKSLKELEKYLQKQMIKAMNDVGEHVKNEVKSQIDEDVYSHTPSQYERTYELRESVVNQKAVISDDKVQVIIKHDNDLIHPYPELYQHYSAKPDYTPDDYSEYVAETVHDGTSGKYFGEGFWTKPRPYMDNTVEKLKSTNSHVEEFKKSLKKQGLDVK